MKHNEAYKASVYFLGMKSEYDNIIDYLHNEVK